MGALTLPQREGKTTPLARRHGPRLSCPSPGGPGTACRQGDPPPWPQLRRATSAPLIPHEPLGVGAGPSRAASGPAVRGRPAGSGPAEPGAPAPHARRDVHRTGNDPARQHHRERGAAVHPARARGDAGELGVGHQRLCPGPGVADPHRRHAGRSLRPQTAFPHRPGHLHPLLRRLRPLPRRSRADRLPGPPGCGRRGDGPPHPLHSRGRLPVRAEDDRHRDLGRRRGTRLRRRPDRRRHPDQAL